MANFDIAEVCEIINSIILRKLSNFGNEAAELQRNGGLGTMKQRPGPKFDSKGKVYSSKHTLF